MRADNMSDKSTFVVIVQYMNGFELPQATKDPQAPNLPLLKQTRAQKFTTTYLGVSGLL